MKSYGEKTSVSLKAARQVLDAAVRDTWSCSPEHGLIRLRTEEILQGKRPGSDLVVLGDEFSPTSQQLWEFEIIEQVLGNTLIIATVDHNDNLDHSTLGDHPFMSYHSQAKGNRSYNLRYQNSGVDHMNVHDITETLQQEGICQSAIILTYHVAYKDKDFFKTVSRISRVSQQSAAQQELHTTDPLAEVEPLQGIPKDQQFPLKLEILFPVMFHRHELIGLNHQALVGCQQTRLICMAYLKLCRPASKRDREWQADTVAKSSQASILEWVRIEKADRDSKISSYLLRDTLRQLNRLQEEAFRLIRQRKRDD